jgi:hypothetical protein
VEQLPAVTQDRADSGGYVERLSAPRSLWAAALGFAAALGIAFLAALGPVAGLLAVVVPFVLAAAALISMTTEVRVDQGELTVGSAHIPIHHLGAARALDADEARAVRGPRSDPAAFHVIRGWLPRGVLAEVVDPADPTPYWYVSSRDPEQLAAAIESARSS